MKYKTFRGLMIGAAVVVLGLGGWKCRSCQKEQEEETRAINERKRAERAAQLLVDPQAGSNVRSSDIPVIAGTVNGGSPETYLLATLGQPASEEKLKDVTHGRGSKINVYNEGGKWVRAKVDHDRDEKWDEKWELDGAIIVRHISDNDDDVYTRELHRQGDAWVQGHAGPPVPDPPPDVPPVAPPVAPVVDPQTPSAPPSPTDWRPLDAAVMRALAAPAQEKIKDATGSTPYKVNLYSDDRKAWNRLKIDLDRDDKWDEKWTLTPDGKIEREVAPADDDVYTEKYERSGDAWVRK